MRRARFLAGVTTLAAVLAAPDVGHPGAAAQVVQRPQGNVTIPGQVPADLPEDRAAAPASPDDRPLWRLLAAGRLAELEARLARLRTDYPEWQPPARMVDALSRAADERALAAARARGDRAEIRRIAAAHPDMVACTRPDDAVAALEPGALAQAVAACPSEAARAALLAAAFDRFGEEAVRPLIERLDAAALPPGARAGVEALRDTMALRRLGAALAARAPDAAAQGAALVRVIELRREAGLATGLGWAELNGGHPAPAVRWFELARRLDTAQPRDGLVRALMAAGQPGAARALLEAEPGPSPLRAEIDQAMAAAAFRRGAYAEVVAQSAGQPDAPLIVAWSLFRLGRFDAAAAAFERRYARTREDAAADGLLQSLRATYRFADAEALASRLGGALQARMQIGPLPGGTDAGYQFHLAWLQDALDRHDMAQAARLTRLLAGPVTARQDGAAATTLGWAALSQDRVDEARGWFAIGARDQQEDARYGAALVALKTGDAAAAEAAAAAQPNSERWRRLRVDALMLQAQRAADAQTDGGGSPAAAGLAAAALRLDPGRRDAALLLAWDARRSGRRAEASAAFERLYRAEPDAAAASGLVAAADDVPGLSALASEVGGPLGPAIRQRAGQDAFARKDFLGALRIDPALDPALPGLDSPSVGGNLALRSKSGGAGTSRLTAITEDLAGTTPVGSGMATVRVHLVTLDSGRPPASGLTSRVPLAAEPTLGWEQQAGTTPFLARFAELGLTPVGGALAPTVQGRAGMGWQLGDLALRASLSRQSVTESVLSYTGARDALGHRFGRVAETGGKLEAYAPLAPRWGVYGSAGAGLRDGVGVRTNAHVQAAATLSYELRVRGFDYATFGPSYQFSAFRRDLSGFTPGQGGYYSPSGAHTVGAALRFQTAESRDFVLRGSALAGWQFARSAGPEGARPTRQDGFTAVGEMVATYRLTERWRVGGTLRYQVSPQYNDVYAGLGLTYSFAPRAALLSADLPRFDSR